MMVALVLALGTGATKAPPSAPLELYSLLQATGVRVPTRLFIKDATLPKRMDIAFSVGVISLGERLILVDAGFRQTAVPKAFTVKAYRSVRDLLVDYEMEAEAVTDVVITHEHWDHWDAIGEIPNATVWLTPKAHAAARGHVRRHLKRLANEKQLRFIEAKTQIAPGVFAVPIGLHTPGFLYVTVEHDGERWLYSSDLGPLRANFERLKSTGQTSNAKATREWLQQMRDLYPIDHIIPSHDLTLYGEARAWRRRATQSRDAE